MSEELKELVEVGDSEIVRPSEYSDQTIQAVKATVFPKATDSELWVFLHKCLAAGCHPLDGMIHPQKYNNRDGGVTLSFIATIDYFRSCAEDAGDYDGQNEAEYEGAIECDGVEVPEIARVSVWRKGIGRPFVGVARWSEFYPGEKKGMLWRKMPHQMLAKCAEAQAFRKAWPKKLNKLYIETEMEQAAIGQGGNSTKPQVSMPQPVQQIEQPVSNSISEKQEKRIYAICKKHGTEINDLKGYLAVKGINHLKDIPKVNYEKYCTTIEKEPGFFKNFLSKNKPAQTEEVMGADEFENKVNGLISGLNWEIDDLKNNLKDTFGFESLDKVPASEQSKVIDFLNMLVEGSK